MKSPRTVFDDCLSCTGDGKDSVTRPELANLSINFGLWVPKRDHFVPHCWRGPFFSIPKMSSWYRPRPLGGCIESGLFVSTNGRGYFPLPDKNQVRFSGRMGNSK